MHPTNLQTEQLCGGNYKLFAELDFTYQWIMLCDFNMIDAPIILSVTLQGWNSRPAQYRMNDSHLLGPLPQEKTRCMWSTEEIKSKKNAEVPKYPPQPLPRQGNQTGKNSGKEKRRTSGSSVLLMRQLKSTCRKISSPFRFRKAVHTAVEAFHIFEKETAEWGDFVVQATWISFGDKCLKLFFRSCKEL